MDQVDDETRKIFDRDGDHEVILIWMQQHKDHGVAVCDCCGNGEYWYGEPGSHYTSQDPVGKSGPYVYNGGLCECH